MISWFCCIHATIWGSCCSGCIPRFSVTESSACWLSTLMWLPMAAFSGHLSDLCFDRVLQKLQMVLDPAEVLLRSLMCSACWCRVDASSAPLEVPFLIALVSTAAVARRDSSSGDDGASQWVLTAMAFEPVAHSGACWYGGRLSACAFVSAHSLVSSLIFFSNISPSMLQVTRPWPHVPQTEQILMLGF